MLIQIDGYLLDKREGEFVNDQGQNIAYRTARFYDKNDERIFKASVPQGAVLPIPMSEQNIEFELTLGEKSHRLRFIKFGKLEA